jgi:hypothetical protein
MFSGARSYPSPFSVLLSFSLGSPTAPCPSALLFCLLKGPEKWNQLTMDYNISNCDPKINLSSLKKKESRIY